MVARDSYAAYRDTGIDWIPDLPSHWGLSRLAHCVRLVRDKQVPNNGDLYVGLENVSSWTGRFIPGQDGEVEGDSTKMPAGAVLLGKLRPYLAKSYLSDRDGWCSSEFFVMLPQELDGRYLHYLTLSRGFVDTVAGSTYGAKMPRANWEYVGKLKIPVPSWDEQKAIARFLDLETARIDDLKAKQERLIELLEEKRQAIITRVVSGGLDSTVPMEGTRAALSWSVPEHWDVVPVKYITRGVTVGIVVTPAKYYVDAGVPCLRSLNVKPNRLVADDLVYISDESNQALAKSQMRQGDIVVVRTGQPGTAAVVDERFDGCNCIDLIIVRRSPLFEPAFLSYQFNSDVVKAQVGQGANGAIQQHFNVEVAKNLVVGLPPLREQQEIVAHLQEQTRMLDGAIRKAQRALGLLQERRVALISEAVTGQIDVHEWDGEADAGQELVQGD